MCTVSQNNEQRLRDAHPCLAYGAENTHYVDIRPKSMQLAQV